MFVTIHVETLLTMKNLLDVQLKTMEKFAFAKKHFAMIQPTPEPL